MVRTQIQLSEAQAQALKHVAARRGVSMAEIIREAVDRVIAESEEAEKWRRAETAIGRFHSGHSDIAVEHDKYLAEDFR